MAFHTTGGRAGWAGVVGGAVVSLSAADNGDHGPAENLEDFDHGRAAHSREVLLISGFAFHAEPNAFHRQPG